MLFFFGGILIALILQGGFPTTQITVDEERISFKREFPSWHLLKKYHLLELVIPHNDWDSWIKVVYRSGEENNVSYYYLFFKDELLRFVAETAQNNNLEYWVQKKFPDRQLETKYPAFFHKYGERINHLKGKRPDEGVLNHQAHETHFIKKELQIPLCALILFAVNNKTPS